ncbi:uncharacterized protein [Tenebrio molitor]|uniref:uncharacterized protein isoform X2 n=1 Tax=Tenebrio molitor TaxID=7067 RepID=UPI003624A9EF
MVRKYVRKTGRQNWEEDVMTIALQEIKNGLPYKTAARMYNLPLSTLKRRAKGKNKIAIGASKILGRFVTTLPKNIEDSLRDYALQMEDRLFGLTKKDICEMAYQLADKNGISNRFSKKKQSAGSTWFVSFLRRYPELSFRTPEATSAARARGFNKEAVAKFFAALDTCTEKHNITDPSQIYNMDESGIQTVPSKLSKVVAHRGRKQVGALTSAERGQNVTVVLCMSAAGYFIPPAIIFPRKRRNELLFSGAPLGTLKLQNESGYMKTDLFLQYLKHFQKHVRSDLENKVLLILDGHGSHKSVEAIEYCREHGIVLLCLPPHCTHKMQPLDVAVFSPLMSAYNEEVRLWMKNNPGKIVTLYNVSYLFGKAYRFSATMNNALSGFEKTGIWPFNPNIFPDWAFQPAATTDRPMENTDNQVEMESPPEPDVSRSSIVHGETAAMDTKKDGNQENVESLEPGPSNLHRKIENRRRRKDSTSSDETEDEWQPSGRSSDEVSIISHDSSHEHDVGDTELSKCNNSAPYFTPFDISPPPIAPPQTRSVRPSQGATILTSTPNYTLTKDKAALKKGVAKSQVKKVTKSLFDDDAEKNEWSRQVKNDKKATAASEVNEKKKKRKGKSDDDVPCLYCEEMFSASRPKEKWSMCYSCKKWAHDMCAGISDSKRDFICDICNTNA